MPSPLAYKIALSLLPKIGGVNARKLVAYTGSIETIFTSSANDFNGIPGIGNALIKRILKNRTEALEKATAEEEFIKKHQLKTYFYLDQKYPKRLAQCSDAPTLIYMKGNVDLNASIIISIVGTRKATDNGRQATFDLVKGLSEKGVKAVIVSGLAYGIDVAAHKAALQYKLATVGVVGHGLDTLYPSSHASIARDMITNQGAMVSDFPSLTKIDPGNFIRRNRIIAGLADCTIVVESAAKGGALVTADIANSYNRDVFAFPGRATDTYAKGCNQLIRDNKAALIENATDLIQFMGWEGCEQPRQQKLIMELSANEEKILNFMIGQEITGSDTLARSIDLPLSQISALLLELEFKGLIKALPGNRFKRMHSL